MSRKQRILKKRYAIFCEGDTEYNYTEKMRKNQGVELVLKPINMHGGGYSNFLRQIKKEAQTNYLARFIIVDADRITTVSGEKENFLKLLEYCRIQNDKGNTPIFVVANNPDFEYIACLHDEEYKGQDTKNYIVNAEYDQVLSEKKKTYADYRRAKQDMKELQTAKYNIEQFYKKEEQDRQAEKQKTEEKTI